MSKPLGQAGSLLIGVVIMTFALTAIGISLLIFTSDQYGQTTRNTFSSSAVLVAEAGIEQSLQALNQDANFAGYTTDQVFFNNSTQGRATFKSVVTPSADGNSKTILSTSKVYRTTTSTTPVSTRKVKVTVVGTGSQGYAVHSGPGGLILGGSANITNSDVYVNGTLQLTGAARIGTAAKPLNVFVANQACPAGASPGSTYPQVCATANPISLQWSTYIYGTVCATGQTSTGPNTNGGNILPGNGGLGLKPNCVAPPATPPTYDRAAQIAQVTTTGAGNSNTYACNSWPFDRTWPANLKLTGNVSAGGSCNIVIKGNTYITGNFSLGGAAKITVDESVGTTRPVVIVDGTIDVGGSGQVIANSKGTGVQFISFKSSAPCSPSCTTVTGNDLKTSQGTTTVNIGGGVNLPGMIFQAYWGKLVLAGSGSIGSAIGQTIDMSGAGTVTFGTTLSSGDATWTVTSYQRVY